MIILEERSGVVSPTKTSGVPEQIVVASFYVCQFFAMCILLPPLSFLRSSAIVVKVLFNIISFYQNPYRVIATQNDLLCARFLQEHFPNLLRR